MTAAKALPELTPDFPMFGPHLIEEIRTRINNIFFLIHTLSATGYSSSGPKPSFCFLTDRYKEKHGRDLY
jgi:hypothetical protein